MGASSSKSTYAGADVTNIESTLAAGGTTSIATPGALTIDGSTVSSEVGDQLAVGAKTFDFLDDTTGLATSAKTMDTLTDAVDYGQLNGIAVKIVTTGK